MRHVKFDPAVVKWIRRMPGPFAAQTHDATMNLAYQNFCEGDTGDTDSRFSLLLALGEAGIAPVENCLGGFVLDRRRR